LFVGKLSLEEFSDFLIFVNETKAQEDVLEKIVEQAQEEERPQSAK
jgi:hypothetical protein